MKQKKIIFLLTLCLILITGNLAFAASCTDVVGDWDTTVKVITL